MTLLSPQRSSHRQPIHKFRSSRMAYGLWPQLMDRTGQYLIERAIGVPERPLGLADTDNVPAEQPPPKTVLPTDLLIASWRSLFPAERMMFLAGRRIGGAICATSVRDVTGSDRSRGHVTASPGILHEALMDWQAAGAHVIGWLHSHPGTGVSATYPSETDWRQDADLRSVFGDSLIGLIATHDGCLRVWGRAVTPDLDAATLFDGRGIAAAEASNVFRLALRV